MSWSSVGVVGLALALLACQAPAGGARRDQVTIPTAPLGFRIDLQHGMILTLVWLADPERPTRVVHIDRREGMTGPYLPLATTTGEVYADHTAMPRTIYCYRLRVESAMTEPICGRSP